MKSSKQDKNESVAGRDVDPGARRAIDPDSLLEQLERGDVVIEFEREEPDDTVH